MKSGILIQDKEKAVTELSKFLEITANSLYQNGWNWHFETDRGVTETFIPNNTSKEIAITREGLSGSIYIDNINVINRFWHDVTHRVMNLGYTLDEERVVIQSQVMCLRLYGISELAQKMFWYDMYGQAYYYDCHKKFVVSQDAFVDSCLKHGLKTACIARH